MKSRRPIFALVTSISVLAGCNCGHKPTLTQVVETGTVVPGSPQVEPDLPTVDQVVQPPPITYKVNVPRQCDVYVQNTVRKVDILWVIQNSGSMASHQAQLAQNFTSFIQFLLSADPPIDFHIGVITTDTDSTSEQGTLHGWTNGEGSGTFIACDQSHACNTETQQGVDPSNSVENAFHTMSQVGITGSSHQRGLYASYLALNRPENKDSAGNGTGFIRDDAALYIVYVGSEDDLSCNPTINSPPPVGTSCRTVDYECACQDNANLDFGSTDFYVRFLENYKGYGHGDLVAAAAVVAVDQHQIADPNFDDGVPRVGCSNTDGSTPLFAYYGKRYVDVVQATGGSATSICASNFNDALTRLGFAVSGLRRDFKLSRGPVTSSIETYESKHTSPTCTTDSDCASQSDGYTSCQAGRCAKAITTTQQAQDEGAEYIRCQNGAVRNVVEFGSDVVPPALGTVEVCYDVDAHFNTDCE